MEKRAIQPDSMRKACPHKPNNPTLKAPSKPPLTIIAKNQMKHHTQKHKETKKKTKTKDSNSP